MKSFKLTNTNPVKEFRFTDKDSYLRIIRLSVYSMSGKSVKLKLPEIISNFHLKGHLRYIVYEHKDYTDERIDNFPIFLEQDTNQTQPIFNLNTLIKTKLFTIGKSAKEHFFDELRIELINKSMPDFDLYFKIEYEEEKMTEIKK